MVTAPLRMLPFSMYRGLRTKKTPKKASNKEMEDPICWLSVSIIEKSRGSKILLQNLLAPLLSMQGMKNLKSELDACLLHPMQVLLEFVGNEDNMGMSLKRRKDFLERR